MAIARRWVCGEEVCKMLSEAYMAMAMARCALNAAVVAACALSVDEWLLVGGCWYVDVWGETVWGVR